MFEKLFGKVSDVVHHKIAPYADELQQSSRGTVRNRVFSGLRLAAAAGQDELTPKAIRIGAPPRPVPTSDGAEEPP